MEKKLCISLILVTENLYISRYACSILEICKFLKI